MLRGAPSGTSQPPAHPPPPQVLATSAQLPPEQRLVMYDGGDEAARAPLGPLRKRLDAYAADGSNPRTYLEP